MNVTAKDIELAQKGQSIFRTRKKAKVKVEIGTSAAIDLPKLASDVLEAALTYIAQGKSVVVVPSETEMSTQQAADLLRVSRPFVVKLLESGEVPYRKIGKHRRVLVEDVLAYKRRIDMGRLAVLEKLAAEAQELGLGY